MRLFLLLLLVLSGCTTGSFRVEELSSPAGPHTGEPFLHASGNDVWMSWIEQQSGGEILKCARWNGNWTEPRTIVSRSPLFVNWADFPSILPLSNGMIVGHWLQKRGKDKYAYDVMASVSSNDGLSWKTPMRVHSDVSESEHGFASLVEAPFGSFSVTWLDARDYETTRAMSLLHSTFDKDTFRTETMIDPRVCDCCQTDTVRTSDGIFVIYRDRSDNEIRDISYARHIDGKWTVPKSLHRDGWKIDGCPVNGPAADAVGQRVAVAWYTGANDQPRVFAAFSNDSGNSFAAPVRVDSGNPAGRVDVVMLEDASAVVSWMENQKNKGADIRIRNIFPDGHADPPVLVADTTNARSSGFPRMTRAGKSIFIAWTFTTDSPRIRVAKIFR